MNRKVFTMVSVTIVFACVATVPVAATAQPYLTNGDFESETSLAGWKVDAQEAQVQIRALSGVWHKCRVEFNSGAYQKAQMFIGAYGGSPVGRCWVDNIQAEGFVVQNPSFEEVEGDSFAGWSQDKPGLATHASQERTTDGKYSAMFYDSQAATQMIRCWQVVEVKPHTDYAYTFDLYMDEGFYGAIRCGVLNPSYYEETGGLRMGGLQAADDFEQVDTILAERARSESQQCVLTLEDGQASLTQDITVPAGTNLEASYQVRSDDLDGEVALIITDIASGRRLAEARVLGSEMGKVRYGLLWKRLRARFVSQSDRIKVQLTGTGTGTVVVDNVKVSPPQLIPPAKQIHWQSAAENLRLPSVVTVTVSGDYGQMLDTGLDMLQDDLQRLGNITLLPRSEAWAIRHKETLAIRIGEEQEGDDHGPESYRLDVGADGITIQAPTERGAFYGLMTLLELLATDKEGRPLALACHIEDWPDMPWRAVHMGMEGLTYEQVARLKFNTVFSVGSMGYTIRQPQRYGLLAIPHDNIDHFPSVWGAVTNNPNLLVGRWKEDEPLVLHDQEPAQLEGRNVLRTDLVDVVVTSEDDKVTYQEGVDYTVIPGELSYPFEDGAKPFAIARLPGSRIADGATVLVDYNHIPTGQHHSALCLAEPRPQEIEAQWAADMVEEYDLDYIAMNISEVPRDFGRDIRDQRTGLSPSELTARFYERIDNAVKAVNPNCRLISTADNFMDWHLGKLGDIGPMLPEDMILFIWNYSPSWIMANGVKTARYWADLDRSYLLCGGWLQQLPNMGIWAQVVGHARQQGWPCLGLATWSYGTGGIEESAICSWQIDDTRLAIRCE